MSREGLGWEKKWFGVPPLFDPEAGTTVVEPLDRGPGWWAGACSALYDERAGRFYLYYRLRKPRELGRGVECRIAESADGIRFHRRDIAPATCIITIRGCWTCSTTCSRRSTARAPN